MELLSKEQIKERTDRIKKSLLSLGADHCGVVSLEQHAAHLQRNAEILLPGTKSVIVFFKKFPRYFYDATDIALYHQDFTDMIAAVDLISNKLAQEIELAGCRAKVIASDDEIEPDRGALFLVHYAVLAGLGSIGKNNLLLTPHFGSMVELGAVITDMELKGDVPIEKELCIHGCSRCVQACPQQALGNGKTIVARCKQTVNANENGDSVSGCWLCRSSCPLNRISGKNAAHANL